MTDHDAEPPRPRLLSWPAVREKVGISRTTAWRLRNEGAFPLPVVISAGRIGWREEEIEAWAASLRKRLPRKAVRLTEVKVGLRLIAPGPEPLISSQATPAIPTKSHAPTGSSTQLGFDF